MALDYLADVKPKEDAGWTDQQIADYYAVLYNRDAQATGSSDLRNNPDVLHIISAIPDGQVLRLTKTAEWQGKLIDYFDAVPLGYLPTFDPADPASAALKAGFELLLTQLQISGRPIFTSTNPNTAGLTTTLCGIVKAICDSEPTIAATSTDIQTAVDKATGGLRFPSGLTAAEVTQSRTDWEAAEAQRQAEEAARQAEQQARNEHSQWQADFLGRYNTNIAPVLDDSPNRDNAALVAALQALATDLQNNPWSP